VHHLSTSFVLAYHGCDRDLGACLLTGSKSFEPSYNDHNLDCIKAIFRVPRTVIK